MWVIHGLIRSSPVSACTYQCDVALAIPAALAAALMNFHQRVYCCVLFVLVVRLLLMSDVVWACYSGALFLR